MAVRLGTSVPTDVRRVTRTMGSARTVLPGECVDYPGRRVVMGGRISPARRLGGISFILSGTLYLSKSILDLVVGDPPSTGPEILEWRSSHELALAWTSEVLFAAAVLLVPAVIAPSCRSCSAEIPVGSRSVATMAACRSVR